MRFILLSQEMDSILFLVHNQINRSISTAIPERVIPEIQNNVSSMSSSGNRDTEPSLSPGSQGKKENTSGLRTKITKKDSRYRFQGRTTYEACLVQKICFLYRQIVDSLFGDWYRRIYVPILEISN